MPPTLPFAPGLPADPFDHVDIVLAARCGSRKPNSPPERAAAAHVHVDIDVALADVEIDRAGLAPQELRAGGQAIVVEPIGRCAQTTPGRARPLPAHRRATPISTPSRAFTIATLGSGLLPIRCPPWILAATMAERREFDPALFAPPADGNCSGLIHHCRTLRREACCACARPIAMPVASRWRESSLERCGVIAVRCDVGYPAGSRVGNAKNEED